MSAPALDTLSTKAGLGKLNGFLSGRSFIVGYSLTQTDVAYANALGDVEAIKGKFKNIYRFWLHVNSFTPLEQAQFPGEAPAAAAPAAAAPAEEKKAEPAAAAPAADDDDDDDDDLFGDSDSDEDDEEAKEAAAKRAAAAKASKAKTVKAAKSSIGLDIKPWDADTDLDVLAGQIKTTLVMDGLLWGGHRKEPLAFGIFKLQMMCTVEDDKVPSTDDIIEPLEAMDLVQSVDIFAFNKV